MHVIVPKNLLFKRNIITSQRIEILSKTKIKTKTEKNDKEIKWKKKVLWLIYLKSTWYDYNNLIKSFYKHIYQFSFLLFL